MKVITKHTDRIFDVYDVKNINNKICFLVCGFHCDSYGFKLWTYEDAVLFESFERDNT